LPSIISLDKRALDTLEGFVSRGGRVVIDLPGGKYDEFTTLLPTGKGSTFEKLFGITLDNFQFSGTNQTLSLNDTSWTGLVADVTPTSAKVVSQYDNGKAAITENKYGKGTAVFIGLDLSHQCFRPGFKLAQEMLIEHTLGSYSSPYHCEDAIVYRLSNVDSDFYFLINDGEAKNVALQTDYSYKKIIDAITGEEVSFDQILLESDDARWLRAEK
jgi:beta-galactosidase